MPLLASSFWGGRRADEPQAGPRGFGGLFGRRRFVEPDGVEAAAGEECEGLVVPFDAAQQERPAADHQRRALELRRRCGGRCGAAVDGRAVLRRGRGREDGRQSLACELVDSAAAGMTTPSTSSASVQTTVLPRAAGHDEHDRIDVRLAGVDVVFRSERASRGLGRRAGSARRPAAVVASDRPTRIARRDTSIVFAAPVFASIDRGSTTRAASVTPGRFALTHIRDFEFVQHGDPAHGADEVHRLAAGRGDRRRVRSRCPAGHRRRRSRGRRPSHRGGRRASCQVSSGPSKLRKEAAARDSLGSKRQPIAANRTTKTMSFRMIGIGVRRVCRVWGSVTCGKKSTCRGVRVIAVKWPSISISDVAARAAEAFGHHRQALRNGSPPND